MQKKHPAPGDSNSVLTWKYAINMWITANKLTQQPKMGSSDNLLFLRALNAVQSLT